MQTLIIGRHASNQIILNDNFVSRQHAQLIILDNGEVRIKDLGSSNGTFVNGNRINESQLNSGDIVKCASVMLDWQNYVAGNNINNANQSASSQTDADFSKNLAEAEKKDNLFTRGATKISQAIANEANSISSENQAQSHFKQKNDFNPNSRPLQQNIVIVGKAKSVGTAFILAFFFGPLGLLYATVTGGIIMFIISIPLAIITLGIGIFFIFPICSIWAVIAANQANKSLQNQSAPLINNNF